MSENRRRNHLSERIDKKLREVPIGEFRFRHEAEFAAGFLSDAGIPYRLQIDDAGGVEFGLSGTRPGVLWVSEMNAEQAQELIHLDELDPEESSSVVSFVTDSRSQTIRRGRLSFRARGFAGGFAVILIVVGVGMGSTAPVGAMIFAALAALFSAIAVTGRAPKPIEAILRMLSGEAP